MPFHYLILSIISLSCMQNLVASDSPSKVVFSDASITRDHNGLIYVTINSPSEIAGIQFSLEYDRDKILLGKPSFSPKNNHFSLYTGGDSSLMKVVAFSLEERKLDLSEPVLMIPLSSKGEYEGILPLTVKEFIASDPDGKKINLKVSAGQIYIVPSLPKQFRLAQNFPNPFNMETVIKFDLPESALVHFVIYNIFGQKVRQLEDGGILAAGFHSITWDGMDDLGRLVSSGEYVCSLRVGVTYHAMKMVLLR